MKKKLMIFAAVFVVIVLIFVLPGLLVKEEGLEIDESKVETIEIQRWNKNIKFEQGETSKIVDILNDIIVKKNVSIVDKFKEMIYGVSKDNYIITINYADGKHKQIILHKSGNIRIDGIDMIIVEKISLILLQIFIKINMNSI